MDPYSDVAVDYMCGNRRWVG